MDAVERGINFIEQDDSRQYYVGYGGAPNSDGVVQCDAAIMAGAGRLGAVAALERVARTVSVARRVMEATPHAMLVGEGALKFARAQGFEEKELLTPKTRAEFEAWRAAGAAKPADQHDTVGLVARRGDSVVAGCSTSGLAYKLPGRVGDTPLVGSGLYAADSVGGAAATGVGEQIMRACLSFLVVELMRQGLSPQAACRAGIERLLALHGGKPARGVECCVVAISARGEFGAATTLGPATAPRLAFPFAVGFDDGAVELFSVSHPNDEPRRAEPSVQL